jgi:hypothetical protein
MQVNCTKKIIYKSRVLPAYWRLLAFNNALVNFGKSPKCADAEFDEFNVTPRPCGVVTACKQVSQLTFRNRKTTNHEII